MNERQSFTVNVTWHANCLKTSYFHDSNQLKLEPCAFRKYQKFMNQREL